MNGMSLETSFYTRLKFIPPTRKSEYLIEIYVRQTIEHTVISIKRFRVKHALSGNYGMLSSSEKSTNISNGIR